MFGVALAGVGHYNPPPVFQGLENFTEKFPRLGKSGRSFFQGLEKTAARFPRLGKREHEHDADT
jgi:hypothetical protein